MRKKKSGTKKLRYRITACLFIIIAVLLIKRTGIDGKSSFLSAAAEYCGRDYSAQEVAAAVSEGLKKAEKAAERLKEK